MSPFYGYIHSIPSLLPQSYPKPQANTKLFSIFIICHFENVVQMESYSIQILRFYLTKYHSLEIHPGYWMYQYLVHFLDQSYSMIWMYHS